MSALTDAQTRKIIQQTYPGLSRHAALHMMHRWSLAYIFDKTPQPVTASEVVARIYKEVQEADQEARQLSKRHPSLTCTGVDLINETADEGVAEAMS